jgi:hypothetical protein
VTAFKVNLHGQAPSVVESGDIVEMQAALSDFRCRFVQGRPRAERAWRRLDDLSQRPSRRGRRAHAMFERMGEKRRGDFETALACSWSAHVWIEASDRDRARQQGIDTVLGAFSDTGRAAWFVEYAEVVSRNLLGFTLARGEGGHWAPQH